MKTLYFIIIYLLLACSGMAHSQEIPNGDGDLLWKIGNLAEGNGAEYTAIHPINSNILVSSKNKIYEYDVKNGNLIRTIQPDPNYDKIINLAITNNGTFIVVCLYSYLNNSAIFKYQVINYGSGINLDTLEPKISMNFFPNDKMEILGRYLGKIVRYSYSENKIINSIPNEYFGIEKYCISPDGSLFAIAYKYTDNYYVDIYDANTFKKIKQLPYTWKDIISSIIFSFDNKFITIGFVTLINSDVINLVSDQNIFYQNASNIFFTKDGKYWLQEATWMYPNVNIFLKEQFDSQYIFHTYGKLFLHQDNAISIKKGDSLLHYSNNWHLVDVNENHKSMEATISPNPAMDYITLNIPPLEKRGLGGVLQEIQIFDIFGNCVLTAGVQNFVSLQRIDISPLPEGMYFVRIGKIIEKFMVLR